MHVELIKRCLSLSLMLALGFTTNAAARDFEFFEEDEAGNINQRNVGVFKSNVHNSSDIHKRSKIVTRSVELNPFSALKVQIPVAVDYYRANNARAEIEGPEHVIENILLVEDADRLSIRSSGLQSSQPITIRLYGKGLERAFISSAAEVTLRDISAQQFLLSVRGAADVTANGSASRCKIDISGAADLDMGRLRCKDIAFTAMGSSDATVNASQSISGLAQGAGDVTILGSPAERSLQARGSYDLSYQ